MSERPIPHYSANPSPFPTLRKPKARSLKPFAAITFAAIFAIAASAQTKPRARDLGVPFDGTPGRNNAITDVAGVEVGHTTLISGEGKLIVGKGPVRTGVTAIHPRGKNSNDAVFAAWFTLNGNGEMTGTTWVDDSGFLNGPVMITNTHSVGIVRDAVIAWKVKRGEPDMEGYWWSLPVVAETWDGYLNDINGFHVHARRRLPRPRRSPLRSRRRRQRRRRHRHDLQRIQRRHWHFLARARRQVRRLYRRRARPMQLRRPRATPHRRHQRWPRNPRAHCLQEDVGSIIVVVATDAPLIPTQLKRIAKKVSLGLGRDGSYSGDGSGDIFLAFSTANPGAVSPKSNQPNNVHQLTMLPNDSLDPIFLATVQATEEAVVNAMVAAETMKGIDDHEVIALPHDRLREVLKKYNRLTPSQK